MAYVSRFRSRAISLAMINVISELGVNVDIEAFENALRRHAEGNPAILGSPKYWNDIITSFTIKAETIFTYEQSR